MPRLRLAALLLFAPVFASAAWAQAQEDSGVQVFSQSEVQEVVLPSDSSEAVLKAEVLSEKGHYRYVAVRRGESGEAELHERWADLDVVQEGGGTLVYGGHLEGGRETEPGERRGGRIVDGETRSVSRGDVMIIPAGVPHQVQVEEGGHIVYTVVKVERPEGAGAQ